ncbi:MAG: hypothetical protein M1831_002792 [Alyxoria varia]|nr:MAG: hypothetical protein M1831_002792 [Alyxoria varia]
MAAPPRDGRHSGPFQLPSIATMTQGMPQDKSPKHSQPSGDMMRDSGMWSMQSPSKHSSTLSSSGFSGFSATSSNGLQLQTILNSDDSPNRFSSASAASAGTPASARLSSQANVPHMGQPHDGNQNANHDPRASIDANNTFFIDSRRSSIDSREIGGLAISSSSPYESTNPSHTASQASFNSGLQQNRSPGGPLTQPRTNGSTVPQFPGKRPNTSGGQPPRRAPPITSNPRAGNVPNPMAAAPTKGFAWAFPENPDEEEGELDNSPQSSRQGSLATSSINAIDSHFGASIPHKAVANLQAGDPNLGAGNYSRTPELRVSHKLAERKRRSEMKDLFDSLNRILPNSPGNKSSKWEVLSKAIEYIQGLKEAYTNSTREVSSLQDQLRNARAAQDENVNLQNEITAMYQQLCRVDPHGHHVFGAVTKHFDQQESHPANRTGGAPVYAPMQGVEYGQYDTRR